MNENKPQTICDPADEAEKIFRRKNTWHSFTTALYSAIGGATFIGVLSALMQLTLGGMTLSTVTVGGMVLSPPLVMAAAICIGVASIYMAQREVTELNCIQGERNARKNAEALKEKSLNVSQGETRMPPAEYPQNQRADGKSWGQIVSSQQPAPIMQKA